MDLIALMLSKQIGSFSENALEQILKNTHASLSIKNHGRGMLILSNNSIIKCVVNYYKNHSSTTKKIKHTNSSLRCHYIHENFGLTNLNVYQCAQCHLECIQKRKKQELQRIFRVPAMK